MFPIEYFNKAGSHLGIKDNGNELIVTLEIKYLMDVILIMVNHQDLDLILLCN